jgi:hypothetical protein
MGQWIRGGKIESLSVFISCTSIWPSFGDLWDVRVSNVNERIISRYGWQSLIIVIEVRIASFVPVVG